MDLARLQASIMKLAKKKGWGTTPSDVIFAEKIALIHQEVSEALEAYRQHKIRGRNSLSEELADAIGRILHLASIYGIDLEQALKKKMGINARRDWNNDQLYIDKRKRKKTL